ncbi:MAG: hypothetical protein ABI183_05215 [Polyangiaceae bacterium]
MRRTFALVGLFAGVMVWSCSSSSSDGSSAVGGSASPGGDADVNTPDEGGAPGAPATIASKARAITEKLGGSHADHLLIGLGGDEDTVYTFGPKLDIHYDYLSGLSTSNGWPTWNQNPDYPTMRIQQADSHGMIFLTTYYCMAAAGDGNIAGSIQDATYMTTYWKDYGQLLASIHAQGKPTLVHMEPDYWGYLEQKSLAGGGAASISAQVAVGKNAECTSEPDNIIGFTHCILAMARARAPEAIMGLHVSSWGSNMDVGDNSDPSLDINAEAQKTIDFFKSIGGDQADFLVTDMSDRDDGCYEAGYTDDKGNVVCKKQTSGTKYWDETNATIPNFHQQQTWIAAVGKGLDLPVSWWQIPLGVPSATSGGTPGHFRDNRVDYMFKHMDELVGAGGFMAAFGPGAGGQTDIASDGDQFKNAATTYYTTPFALP